MKNKQRTADAIESLKKMLRHGGTLTCVKVNHGRLNSRRHLVVLVPLEYKIEEITGLVALATESHRNHDGGISCQDSGYDLISLLCIRLGWEYNALKVQSI